MKIKLISYSIMLAIIVCAARIYSQQGPVAWSAPFSLPNTEPKIVLVELSTNGCLYIHYRQDIPQFYPEYTGHELHAWTDVYCASNNQVVFKQKVVADIHSATHHEIDTPESIDWKL